MQNENRFHSKDGKFSRNNNRDGYADNKRTSDRGEKHSRFSKSTEKFSHSNGRFERNASRDFEDRNQPNRERSFGRSSNSDNSYRSKDFSENGKRPYRPYSEDSQKPRSFSNKGDFRKPYGANASKPYNREDRGYSSRPNRYQHANSDNEEVFTQRHPRSSENPSYRKEYNADRKPFGDRKRNEYGKNYNTDSKKEYDGNNVYSKKKQLEYKKNFVNLNDPVRLNKFIANSGICSRREADEYIQAGVITVNGEIVTELGVKVIPAKDRVLFHDQLLQCEKKVYVLLNKPKDCVTTVEDTHDRMTVMDLVRNACSERIYPVGRLDRNTTGVLLLTNDGELATLLTHPKYNKKKIYQVTLDKPISQDDAQKLLNGITLEDGEIHADEISFLKEDDARQLGVEIHSGRNRIIRRMFEQVGYTVIRLDRVFFAGLTKKKLPRGKWRFLSEKEVSMLKMGAFE